MLKDLEGVQEGMEDLGVGLGLDPAPQLVAEGMEEVISSYQLFLSSLRFES